ncbi:MarR family winged helix-turn-helix transcriptional regulator [Trujillonella humicola]|uniref:MarR family winged helix-turn-helix transcriptional regulator n=1 Tax=Trujillonella humicola TaxID=3383699 RepID=UPI003906B946
MTRWLDEHEQRAWRGLLRMTSRLDARLNRELQRTSGLSLADYDVLVLLSETEGGRMRVFEVVEALQWEQSRLSHHLARMQRRGLVAREECSTDRRGAFVVLGEAGRDAIERAAPAHVEVVRRLVFDGLTEQQVAALDVIATTVLARLGPGRPGEGADTAGALPAALSGGRAR